MAQYNSSERTKSGVPLGGVGCGAVEIFNDGTMGNFTSLNTWRAPSHQKDREVTIVVPHFSRGNHFGVFMESKGQKWAKVLQTSHVGKTEDVFSGLEKKGTSLFC